MIKWTTMAEVFALYRSSSSGWENDRVSWSEPTFFVSESKSMTPCMYLLCSLKLSPFKFFIISKYLVLKIAVAWQINVQRGHNINKLMIFEWAHEWINIVRAPSLSWFQRILCKEKDINTFLHLLCTPIIFEMRAWRMYWVTTNKSPSKQAIVMCLRFVYISIQSYLRMHAYVQPNG